MLMARFGHRFGSIASVIALVGGMLLVPVPPVAAAACSVENDRIGTTHETLQGAVDAAVEGDTLLVSGTCAGKTVIRTTRLVLKGVATTQQPAPTLDGDGVGRVLVLTQARVVLRGLTVTNGKSWRGGGVYVHGGRLSLTGTSSVSGNEALVGYALGGGIYNVGGTVILNDSASVTRNTAGVQGGGIYSLSGTVILNDSASVTRNTAKAEGSRGGGIFSYDSNLSLNDSSSVSGNDAPDGGGGGIYNVGGTVILNDSASVTRNTARYDGGIRSKIVYVCSDEVAISPNDPDDPPETLPCPS